MRLMMKRALALLMVLLLVFCMVACGKDGDTAESETDDTKTGFYIKSNGTRIVLGAPATAVLSALGEANSQNELFDCGAGNSRMLYRYSSFDLYTMKSGESEVIDQIELKDDLSETDKGICLGSKESEVTAAYGKADRTNDGSLTYVSGAQEMTFDIENGQVVGIGLLRVTQ